MTDIAINPVTRRVQFTGNTGTGPYAFTFNILQSSDITVYKNNALFTLTTDYTVSIASNGTGSVTTVVALISSDILTIIGGRQLSRTTDFVTAGDLLASSLNEQLDSNVIMSQQLDERFDRSMKAQPGDTNANMNLPLVADRANGFLTFDNSGNVAINTIQNLDLLNLVQLNIGNITIEGDTVSTSSGNGLAFSSGDDLELAVPASNARIYFKRATATAIDWSLGSSHQSLRFINTSSGGVSASIDATHLTSSASALEIRSEGAALTLNSGDGTIPLEHDGTQRGYLNLDTAGTIKIYTGTGTGTLNTTFSSDALTVVGTLTAGALFIGGANISEVELEMLDSITAGTVAASKAVVVDANKDISSFRNVTISGKITSDSNADVTIEPNGSGDFVVETDSSHFRNTDAGQFGPKLFLDHATSSPATSDYNAQVYFKTTDLGSNIIYPLRIDVLSPDVTDSAATGKALFNIKEDGASDPIAYLELDGDSEEIILWKNTSISGDLVVTGAISKGSGSFKIDHPIPSKKDTHHLVHSFLEGPQADLIYRGVVNLVGGSASVNIDTAARMTTGTFVLLCGNVQSFTSNESGWTAVKSSVSGNTLTITAQDNTCTDSVSWMVVGERKDQHMLDTNWTDENGRVIVEPEKQMEE